MNKEKAGLAAHSADLQAAVELANIPTLACLLVHLTGQIHWVQGRYIPTRTRGLDDNDSGGLDADVQAEIRRAALDALRDWFAGQPLGLANPSDELLVQMLGISLGETIPPEYAGMIRHELGLAESDDTLPAPGGDAAAAVPGVRALIIGAGISGLCAAINLARAGIPYTIVERHSRLGGVWLENRYPGAACDVPSYLYSFSFAPHDWSRFFAAGGEIHAYLEKVAKDFAIEPHIRFGVEVTEARYDEVTDEWVASLVTQDGKKQALRANILISAVGAFNKPRFPNVPGLAEFRGPSLHTARWPVAGVDLKGRRVVVIGNGASAMQVVPAIADEVASLTVIQRSPQWAAPFAKFKQPVPSALQWLLREMPLYRLWYRLRLSWAFNDKQYPALQKDPLWKDPARSVNAINDSHRRGLTAYIESEIGAARHLLPQVVPGYPPFGKRMLLDNGWFRTLTRPHVHLVTGAVTRVLPDRVVASDGTEHEADVLIWATGFDVVNFLAPMRVFGREGRELHRDWDGDDARAYLGTVVPGYPNFFCLYGPNTQFGHGGSLITIVERQMHYVMSALRQMFARDIAAIDVRRDIHDAYSAKVDSTHEKMVWTHPGMDTYYRNSKGRVVVNNPFRIVDYWQMSEQANLSEFELTPRRDGASSQSQRVPA